jgi:membrane-associated phospholipid phosphatase
MGAVLRYFCSMYSNVLSGSLWQQLDEWDKWLFLRLNGQWTNSFFDAVFPYLRDALFWTPLYLFILVFILANYGVRGLLWSLLFICTVALTDMIGARVFKEGIERLRPCQDPLFSDHVRLLLKQCSGSYSFVSNHAANHFGLATFAFVTFKGVFKQWMWVAFGWAFFIAYAQVYVGVHYPFDVLGGAVLGILIGTLTATFYNRKWGRFSLDNN